MELVAKDFAQWYLEQLVERTSSGSHDVRHITSALTKCLESGGRVFAFGNGGSSAIVRSWVHQLRSASHAAFAPIPHPTVKANGTMPGLSFLSELRLHRPAANDLVIVVSAGGESDNMLEIVEFCQSNGIPTLIFAGRDRCSLTALASQALAIQGLSTQGLPTQGLATQGLATQDLAIQDLAIQAGDDARTCVVAGTGDQQCDEDILQALGVEAIEKLGANGQDRTYARDLEDLELDRVGAAVAQATTAIVEGFGSATPVCVLGRGSHICQLSAEHTAHNLNWDAVYRVETPPLRVLLSSPTICDLTGITNDRHGVSTELLPRITAERHRATALTFEWRDSASRPSGDLLVGLGGEAADAGATTLVSGGFASEFRAGAAAQVFGHLLGRLVGSVLRTRELGLSLTVDYLIGNDLAQRRALDQAT